MPTRLSIRDVVLIDRLDIDIAPRLSVAPGRPARADSFCLLSHSPFGGRRREFGSAGRPPRAGVRRLRRTRTKAGRCVLTLAVTHASQVAARADRHYLITKNVLHKAKRVATRTRDREGYEEIARMLSGTEIIEEARAAGERLMRNSGVVTHGA